MESTGGRGKTLHHQKSKKNPVNRRISVEHISLVSLKTPNFCDLYKANDEKSFKDGSLHRYEKVC